MDKPVRVALIAAVAGFCVLAALVAIRISSNARSRREAARIVRRPSPAEPTASPPGLPHPAVPQNLAPMATVTVSSIQENSRSGEGVADGVVDGREWIAGGATSGAWIRLDWENPVTVVEIELYDRPDLQENVLSGTLIFDDGSMIAVPPLPPDGAPWQVNLPPKIVHSILFRIDRAEGRAPGLEEIKVYGAVSSEPRP